MTTTEYLQTPETVLPRELAFGVLRVAESPTVLHQRVVRDLTLALCAFVKERHIGEVLPAPMDVVLDYAKALVVQPDLLFVSNGRREIITDRVYWAPDVVIEVLSPRPRIGRLDERVAWFAQYGVRECWVADAVRKEMAVLTFGDGQIAHREVAKGATRIPTVVLDGLRSTPDAIFGW
jgi:Uma2 family endonuclease